MISGAESPARPGLVDSFGRRHDYLRVSLTDRCNLRCTYCMPAEGVPLSPRADILTFSEIERLVRVMAGMGVNKVRLTGGEPLVRRGVAELVALLDAVPGIESVAMTTNGVRLKKEAAALRDAGLTTLNISLDTLRPARFAKLTRRNDFEKVIEGIDAAFEQGFPTIKLNTVVMRGVNCDELEDFVEFVRHRPIEVRFIEYMPFEGNGWSRADMVTYDDMMARLTRTYNLTPAPGQDPSAPARTFTIEGFQGKIGIIASMTQSFCAQCTRIRLTADGALKTCLFHNPEWNLRDMLRAGADDEVLQDAIRRAVHDKPEGHAALGVLEKQPNRSMVRIGG